jgi:hypothetical protein
LDKASDPVRYVVLAPKLPIPDFFGLVEVPRSHQDVFVKIGLAGHS